MDIQVYPDCLNGKIKAIASKSQAHRALICAALCDEPTHIKCSSVSDDITATALCLTALGAGIESVQDGYNVSPITKSAGGQGTTSGDDAALLPCLESGSTFRFLLPVAGALGRRSAFDTRGRLPMRPLSPLYEQLTGHGCVMSAQGSSPFEISGQLTSGRYELDGGVSSQFISGLLFALPILRGDSEIYVTGQLESLPYIELTLDMLSQFGIKASFDGSVFAVPGSQIYKSPGSLEVEGDWSNTAFWLCAGAAGTGTITCTGLNLKSKQGDKAICDILDRFGAWVTSHDDEAAVSADALSGIELDACDTPDLVPVIAVVAALAEGVTTIKNAGRLRLKESDRLAAVTAMLTSLGADVKETEDGLIINGIARSSRFRLFPKRARLRGGSAVSSYGDHRIAMAAAVAATACKEPVVIEGAEAVNKSYPGFFEDFKKLGGSYRIL